ncbi:hypothetical protein [Flavobacterium sp.]|uniref:hypothetical protein n=1 Tax=Flavobacterium sp. TaxID=239 RepID=UPI00286DBE50|nr:hypothetical protein [Flavobacterium sp.]
MESNNIEILIEKYFQAETSIAEEKELRSYFSTPNVAPHLEQYKAMFGFFTETKKQEFTQEIPLKTKKRNVRWLTVAASIVILLGMGTFFLINDTTLETKNELGSYDNPEEAFKETQKALALLSSNVNVGIESVMYVQEYEITKNRVFKK